MTTRRMAIANGTCVSFCAAISAPYCGVLRSTAPYGAVLRSTPQYRAALRGVADKLKLTKRRTKSYISLTSFLVADIELVGDLLPHSFLALLFLYDFKLETYKISLLLTASINFSASNDAMLMCVIINIHESRDVLNEDSSAPRCVAHSHCAPYGAILRCILLLYNRSESG